MICDGISNVHDPITVFDGDSALRVLCIQCKKQFVIRKSPNGAPEIKQYAKIFKRDILQGSDNLFYKVYPQHLKN